MTERFKVGIAAAIFNDFHLNKFRINRNVVGDRLVKIKSILVFIIFVPPAKLISFGRDGIFGFCNGFAVLDFLNKRLVRIKRDF